jgi:hypothetical protein
MQANLLARADDRIVEINVALPSLLGVKRTWVGALHMSAFDPKRTSLLVFLLRNVSGSAINAGQGSNLMAAAR